ncbi:MAG: host attachment protein [Deltaproteobacteria bacterium]|nr:host attachment protein [Deltaproteobacteria bacterium]
MLPRVSWILVANRSSAKLFVQDGPFPLRCARTIEHPEGRLRDSEINADKSGRAFPRHGKSFPRTASSPLEKHNAPHEHEAEVFAGELAGLLNDGAHERSFDRLYLVAEPRFLGYLRRALTAHAASLVVASEPKDVAGWDEVALTADVKALLESEQAPAVEAARE